MKIKNLHFMKWLLFIVAVVSFVIYYRKRNKKELDEKPIINNSKKINTSEFNTCVVLFLDLYNELTERIKKSINSDNRFNLDEKVKIIKEIETGNVESIKQTLRLFHLQGKFDDVIDDYLIGESNIDAIIYRIIEISKATSNIPNHVLIGLESKEIYIKSSLQNEIEAKIKRELFLINSVQEAEFILLEFISITKDKLETIAISRIQ